MNTSGNLAIYIARPELLNNANAPEILITSPFPLWPPYYLLMALFQKKKKKKKVYTTRDQFFKPFGTVAGFCLGRALSTIAAMMSWYAIPLSFAIQVNKE